MANAIVAQGSKLWRGAKEGESSTWDKVNSVSAFSGPNTTKSKIDVTDFDSSRKKYVSGLADDGDIQFTLFFNPADATHRAIVQEDIPDPYGRAWRMELSDGTLYEFYGTVTGAPLSGSIDGVVQWTVTITVSGNADWVWKGLSAQMAWDSTLAGTESSGAVTGSVTATLSGSSGVTPKFKTGTFVAGVDYTLTAVPDGLVGTIARTSDTVATLSFTGTATNKSDVTDIRLAFLDHAFQNNMKAVEVNGSTKNNIAITFV